MAQEDTQKPIAAPEQGGPGLSPTPPPQVVTEKVEAPVIQEVVAPEKASEPAQEVEKPAAKEEGTVVVEKVDVQSELYKADTYVASELPEAQRKALEEFKERVREALNKREFSDPPPAPVKEEEKKEEKLEEKKSEQEVTKEVEEEKNETSAVAETKTDEKSATPATTESEKGKVPVAPETSESKNVEKSSAPASTESKQEEKPVVPETTESNKEEKSAVPATTETKKEEKPAVSEPALAETKPAEKLEAPAPAESVEETIVPVSAPETAAPPAEEAVTTEEEPVEPEEVSIWGVPLLQDERSDVVLLKFLRARDFKVKEAFTMLRNTVRWRKENNIDDIVGEDLEGNEFEKMVFTSGVDKKGHVVIYSAYGEFQNKEVFSDKEKLNKFLKWRIQFQEKCVRALDLSPTTKSSFVFVSDFRNAPGLGKRALWQFIRRAVKLFEDNYPEFSAQELFINVPWWYIPYYRTFGSIVTSPRTKSKMVLAGPAKSADTIFKYIAPEQVPVKYGGLSNESRTESLFSTEEAVTEVILKPAAKHSIDLPASEACLLSWELRVLGGSDVSYGAQFEPSTEGSYTVIVSKNAKMGMANEPVITDSFKVGEPGKVVITIDNQTSKKKKLLYRFKTQG